MISNNSGILNFLSAITIKMVQDCTAVSEICDANGKTMWKTKCVVKPYISVIKWYWLVYYLRGYVAKLFE